MEIITNCKENYEQKIEKYYSKKKKWDVMENAMRAFLMASTICMFAFYALFVVYLYTKITGGNATLVFHIMILSIFSGIILAAIASIIEWKRFELSSREKIWNTYIKEKDSGFLPKDIVLWFDSDKIYAHIIYENLNREQHISFCRVDEFIVIYDECEEPYINLDTYLIKIPKDRKNLYIDKIKNDL